MLMEVEWVLSEHNFGEKTDKTFRVKCAWSQSTAL